MRLGFATVPVFTAVMACTPVTQTTGMALGPSPVLDGGVYSTGGGITVAAELMNIGGMMGLCGVWAESKRQAVLSKGKARNVLHTGSAYVNGTILHRDLGFMTKVDPTGSYGGQQAACVQTQTPYQAGQTLKLRIPKQVVHREIDDADGVGIAVVFRQTGPGAMNPSLKSLILDN
ncbi:MAG: hypothetical protein AB8B82_01875 [Roseovarius sp.]